MKYAAVERAESNESAAQSTQEPDREESVLPSAGVSDKSDKTLKQFAQKCLDAAGFKVDLNSIEETIRSRPLYYLSLTAGAGFVMGRVLSTATCMAALRQFGRNAAAQTASNWGRQVLQHGLSGTEYQPPTGH